MRDEEPDVRPRKGRGCARASGAQPGNESRMPRCPARVGARRTRASGPVSARSDAAPAGAQPNTRRGAHGPRRGRPCAPLRSYRRRERPRTPRKDGETPPQGDKDRGPAEEREGPPGPASAETEHGAACWGRRHRQGAAKQHSEGRSHDLKDREPSSGGPAPPRRCRAQVC